MVKKEIEAKIVFDQNMNFGSMAWNQYELKVGEELVGKVYIKQNLMMVSKEIKLKRR